MANVVGIQDARQFKSKKTGLPLNVWFVYYEESREGVVGMEAGMQMVNADLFTAAVGARELKALIGRECQFVYNNRGFLQGFSVK